MAAYQLHITTGTHERPITNTIILTNRRAAFAEARKISKRDGVLEVSVGIYDPALIGRRIAQNGVLTSVSGW